MKGQTAIPHKAYLIAPIVEFDEKKKKIASQLSSLFFLVAPLAISFKYFSNPTWIILGFILISGCSIAGLIGLFGIRSYHETGLVEMSKDYFTIIKDREEIQIKWNVPEAVTLVYLTDYQGEGRPIINQIEKCWLGYTLDNKTHQHYFLLTFGAMGRSIFKLANDLNKLYPNVKAVNAFGNKNDELIKKEEEEYKHRTTCYNTAQA